MTIDTTELRRLHAAVANEKWEQGDGYGAFTLTCTDRDGDIDVLDFGFGSHKRIAFAVAAKEVLPTLLDELERLRTIYATDTTRLHRLLQRHRYLCELCGGKGCEACGGDGYLGFKPTGEQA